MSVRVVARIRPLLEKELGAETIVCADSAGDGKAFNVVKIPNPKNESEEFSFAFNGVFDRPTTQEELFNAEVFPHVKALFQGLDVTIFAYGVTGTGKTHTMRGGLTLAERGVIPRLLSIVFRRSKKMAKDSGGVTSVDVALSYYEIYNDKVFDLLEPPEKRTPSGLPLREKDGRTIVVGLSQRECKDLKDFEKLYLEANSRRVEKATKLNARSSRSHAILRVKVTQTRGNAIRESTASAIDLAGSEDNRRTDNSKERLVESAAINKSLFVLGQCIEAIARGDKRIPYRESKMTRILSLGQNNGITIMILNLAPIRSYHLDTLSSLNVSSRAKRIEVREIENEIVFKTQPPRTGTGCGSATFLTRQPLRALSNAQHNVLSGGPAARAGEMADKAGRVKAFNVYPDRDRPSDKSQPPRRPHTSAGSKRPSDQSDPAPPSRASKMARTGPVGQEVTPAMSAAQIEVMIERKVQEALAARICVSGPEPQKAPPAPAEPRQAQTQAAVSSTISAEVRRRLEALERRVERTSDHSSHDGANARSAGRRLLMEAKLVGATRGNDTAALAAYRAALECYPSDKLHGKIARIKARLGTAVPTEKDADVAEERGISSKRSRKAASRSAEDEDGDDDVDNGAGLVTETKPKQKPKRVPATAFRDFASPAEPPTPTPRAKKLLDIVNSRDAAQIRELRGMGAKKTQDVVDYLAHNLGGEKAAVRSLAQLKMLPGMGGRSVDRAYDGLVGCL